MTGNPRVLVIGAGYIAGHVGRRLTELGHSATLSSRRRPVTPESRGLDWLPVDMADRRSVHALVELARPDALVVAHGPSDITWCETNPGRAAAVHLGGATYLAETLEGRRALLVSTDNVFPGREDSCAESEPTEPANAYGRAKLAAEETLLATGNALALRVSLVYGWDRAGLRPNFFTSCALRLRRAEPVAVPHDHWNTPVLVDDVAAWTAALLAADQHGIVHLGGPRRLSRVAWARHIAEGYGVDPGLVSPAPRQSTGYACRPRNACLHSERAADIPELEELAPKDVLKASIDLIATGEDPP